VLYVALRSALKQIEIFEITSPCIGVCQSGPKGFCVGCFRSREERVYWIKLEQDVQSKIIKACAVRKKRAKAVNKKKQNSTDTSSQLGFLDDSFTQNKQSI
jgi:predicted Fe-S protein YdhL (DUF1289 family)